MKQFTLLLTILFLGAFTMQAQNLSSCKQTCEVEVVIQEGPFLGATISNVSSCANKVLVRRIIENSAAAKFDFREGDLILSIDGIDMENITAVKNLILAHEPGDFISVIISRDGEDVIKDVVIGAQKTRIETKTVCCDEKNAFLNDMNVRLSPNPSTDFVNLSLVKAKAGKYTFQIFNTAGVEVLVSADRVEAGFQKQFDVSKYAAGQYFLKISEGKESFTTSFVVAH